MYQMLTNLVSNFLEFSISKKIKDFLDDSKKTNFKNSSFDCVWSLEWVLLQHMLIIWLGDTVIININKNSNFKQGMVPKVYGISA